MHTITRHDVRTVERKDLSAQALDRLSSSSDDAHPDLVARSIVVIALRLRSADGEDLNKAS